MTLFTLDQLRDAAELVGRRVPPTPQFAWPLLAARTGAEVWVKHENHTPAGAFKVRGGLAPAYVWRGSSPSLELDASASRIASETFGLSGDFLDLS